jgi:hypothetical protein
MAQDKIVAYEIAVTSGTPNIHYPRMDLGDAPVRGGWLVNDGYDDLLVSFDDDSTQFSVKCGEVVDLTDSEIYKVIINTSGSADYRLVCAIMPLKLSWSIFPLFGQGN